LPECIILLSNYIIRPWLSTPVSECCQRKRTTLAVTRVGEDRHTYQNSKREHGHTEQSRETANLIVPLHSRKMQGRIAHSKRRVLRQTRVAVQQRLRFLKVSISCRGHQSLPGRRTAKGIPHGTAATSNPLSQLFPLTLLQTSHSSSEVPYACTPYCRTCTATLPVAAIVPPACTSPVHQSSLHHHPPDNTICLQSDTKTDRQLLSRAFNIKISNHDALGKAQNISRDPYETRTASNTRSKHQPTLPYAQSFHPTDQEVPSTRRPLLSRRNSQPHPVSKRKHRQFRLLLNRQHHSTDLNYRHLKLSKTRAIFRNASPLRRQRLAPKCNRTVEVERNERRSKARSVTVTVTLTLPSIFN
jgi:hypothetical protein